MYPGAAMIIHRFSKQKQIMHIKTMVGKTDLAGLHKMYLNKEMILFGTQQIHSRARSKRIHT